MDKVISVYFACVTKEPFTWKGITYKPKPLTVSPLLFRGLECPSNCGACCHPYTMDYLIDENKPNIKLEMREIMFKNKKITLYSDMQNDVKGYHCRHMDKNGRCKIHAANAFSCDFELLRFLIYNNVNSPNRLTNRLYGRGWNMLRCDNIRGALCKITPETENSRADTILKLFRLAKWCEYFGLSHKVDMIIDWALHYDNSNSITI